ncbi:hypothetical protein PoB_000446800 [Plakobranchus ocellatus]|uniref:AMP-dependent synthetase/ligase domain-containing protein n=1 Tax=Plakobranchus ocellatus TaxID=259542 RepID=A0AAV3Y6Y6_9GAST|nr:hypothetical protein PoB_000446800 [Plakobranchus ocellatus]
MDRGPASVVAYMCTSGSTGEFKLLSFTSQFLVGAFYGIMTRGMGMSKDSVYLNDKPFGWLGGFPALAFSLGATRVTIEDTVPRDGNYASLFWKFCVVKNA